MAIELHLHIRPVQVVAGLLQLLQHPGVLLIEAGEDRVALAAAFIFSPAWVWSRTIRWANSRIRLSCDFSSARSLDRTSNMLLFAALLTNSAASIFDVG